MTPEQMRKQDERDLKHLQLISQLLGGVRQVVNTTVERDPKYYKRGTRIKATLDKIEAYEAKE